MIDAFLRIYIMALSGWDMPGDWRGDSPCSPDCCSFIRHKQFIERHGNTISQVFLLHITLYNLNDIVKKIKNENGYIRKHGHSGTCQKPRISQSVADPRRASRPVRTSIRKNPALEWNDRHLYFISYERRVAVILCRRAAWFRRHGKLRLMRPAKQPRTDEK